MEKEGVEAHQQRLLEGLQAIGVTCWPWDCAVALKESRPEMTHYHIIHNWLWLGAVENLDEATELLRTPAGFDQDGYKILCKPLLAGNYEIIPLNDPEARKSR